MDPQRLPHQPRHRDLLLLLSLIQRLQLHPRHASLQSSPLHTLELTDDLLPVVRDLVGLARVRPEALHAEAVVEVRAEVVHYGDRKHDVPSKANLARSGGEGWEAMALHSKLWRT